MSAKQIKVIFKNVGIDDHLPYSKADLVKISRITNNYSLSFYQLDYQAMAVRAQNASTPDPDKDTIPDFGNENLIPVGKIVFDEGGFKQLLAEIEQIQKTLSNDK